MVKTEPGVKAETILETVRVALDQLSPYPANPRAGDIEAITESLRNHGQYRALVVNKRTMQVLAGNHTLHALHETGATEALVHYVDVDEEEAARIVLVDNRTNDLAKNDDGLLVKLLESLPSIEGTGYDQRSLDELLARVNPPQGLTDPDDVPAAPKEAVTKPGDLWLLGEHRLLCGDSRADIPRLMAGEIADMVWTDPPYGVGYQANESAASLKARNRRTDGKVVENDSMAEHETERLFREVAGATASVSRAGAAWYVAAPPGPLHHLFAGVLKDLGIWHQTLNWVKNALVMGRSDYHYRHEPIFYGWMPGAAHYFDGGRKQDTVWEIDRPTRSDSHPTMKPVELVERAIRNSSRASERVLDPFGGSGSTLIACERSNRVARVIEIDPGYCDVICRRFEEFSGVVPVLEATGETHSFLPITAARE